MTVALTRHTGIERIAPLCEMRGCERRAEYFWLILPAKPDRFGWIPVCHECVQEFAVDLLIEAVPIAEQSIPARHHPPLGGES